jgi:DNA-binding PadR family transcriptional regulator
MMRSLSIDPPASITIDNVSSMDIVPAMLESNQSIDALLPLPPATLHILMSLAENERHGYAIIQDVEARTEGEVRLSPGTLYRSIQRMLDQGLIVESKRRPAAALDDERRRYYRITTFGLAVGRAELRRLTQLVRLARARGLMPETS